MPPRSRRFRAATFAPPSATIRRRPQKDLSFSEIDDAATAPKCIVTHEDFDWQGDQPLRHPWTSTVIYELHVRGYTIDPSAGVRFPGTYRGLIEKIPYLKDLGITAVELMPVQEFNEHDVSRVDPTTGERLKNYWGYDPLGFFAPKASYASVRQDGAQVLEFKEMVRAFHRAGLEVILDVVFNHTCEGDELGPTVCFRGHRQRDLLLAGRRQAVLPRLHGQRPDDQCGAPGRPRPHPRRPALLGDGDARRRLPLRSRLGARPGSSTAASWPTPPCWSASPKIRSCATPSSSPKPGMPQVPIRWARSRSAAGRNGMAAFAMTCAGSGAGMRECWAPSPAGSAGSSDLYAGSGKGPECSINFVTCHDGFTLNDLVSYERKHNEANGEDNRDGADENYSANYGVEGESDDPAVEAVRRRQIKNFLLTLAISRGVPMLLGGDEFRRTQRGNNNAYCQDNETSWVDWSLCHRHDEILRFARNVLALRRDHPVLRREAFYTDEDIQWFDPRGRSPDWSDHALAKPGVPGPR